MASVPSARRVSFIDIERLPVHVVRSPQREVQQTRANGRVRHPIDQNEPAQVAILTVRLEGDRLVAPMPHTPMSFSSSFLAATCSRVLTFTLYMSGDMVAVTVRVPIFIRYDRPWSIGCSCIQTIVASKWSATAGGSSAAERTSGFV
jgi:hypothetical protein